MTRTPATLFTAACLAACASFAAAQDPPALNQPDTQTVVGWIARQVADSRQDYCYRQTDPRGVGKPLSTCAANEDKDGLLCYPKCEAGYHGVGPVCWQGCPQGYTDTGAFCTRPAVSEHIIVDHPHCPEGFHNTGVSCYDAKKLKSESLSHARCASGLHKKGELCYSECAAGFTNTGVSCYRGPDTVAKKSRGRGAGSPMKCRPGEEEDAGLCYPACKAGFSGVGPVCWQGCPAARINCGAGCASGRTACVADIGNMVVAPATLAYNIATFGSAAYAGKYLAVVSALKAAARARAAGNAALQAGVTVKLWVDDFAAHFDKMTTPEVKRQIEMRFSPRAQEWIKRQYALNHLHLMLTRDVVETDLRELSAISGFDPSGVTGVISAFAKPICSSADPFPSVRAFY